MYYRDTHVYIYTHAHIRAVIKTRKINQEIIPPDYLPIIEKTFIEYKDMLTCRISLTINIITGIFESSFES